MKYIFQINFPFVFRDFQVDFRHDWPPGHNEKLRCKELIFSLRFHLFTRHFAEFGFCSVEKFLKNRA